MVRYGDHPRSRGVYESRLCRLTVLAGSSPLARGLRLRFLRVSLGGRIIPARAGFTATADALNDSNGDHPRSRGVYRWSLSLGDERVGSSPLARGLHFA